MNVRSQHEEKKLAIKEQFVTKGKSEDELAEEFGVPKGTISSWASRDGWREERKFHENLARELTESVSFLVDPNTEEKALAEGNRRILLQIQGLHLAKIKHDILAGKPIIDIADAVQKYTTALNKINDTKMKMDGDHDPTKAVMHYHLDMDKALELALEARRRGQSLTINEAAEALVAQQKEKNEK